MKGRIFLVIALIFIFSGGRIAMAHEDDKMKHAPSTSSLKSSEHSGDNMEGMDMSGDNGTDGHDMEGMDMSDDHSSDGHDDMEGMDMESGEGGHSHGPVTETPPNVKVLGTYGAVNFAFILIGVWNKWLRRKGGSDVNSK